MTTAKYNYRANPVYQIDFSTSSKGKRLSLTKRCINFRFGFSNAEAIQYGQHGMYCRGEEHEVTLRWSLTSGKRIVKLDNKEVHFSLGKRTDMRFECAFQIRGNRTIKLVAHAASPAMMMMSPTKGFRQFEMFLDGLSFFDMPRIFELGDGDNCHQAAVVENDVNSNNTQMAYNYPSNVPASGTSVRNDNSQYPMVDTSFDTSFDASFDTSVSTYPQIRSDMTIRSEARSYEATPLPDTTSRAPSHFDSSFAQLPVSMSLPSTTKNTGPFINNAPVYEFAPVSPPPPTFQGISNQNINTHEQPPSNPGILAIENGSQTESGYSPMNEPQMTSVQPQYAQPPPPTHASTASSFSPTPPRISPFSSITTLKYTEKTRAPRDSPVSSIATPEYTEKLSMNYLQCQAHESPQSVRQLDGLAQAMQNLVNFENMCEPVESPMKLTMMKEKETKKHSNKSQGLPPVQVAWHLGAQVSLANIKVNAAAREAPTREVMRKNGFDPAASQAGMMVVHGIPVANQAPPLQSSFGYNAYGGAY